MSLIRTEKKDTLLKIFLKGHIDSANASQAEAEITEAVKAGGFDNVQIDASELEYISSAGLRVILRLRKNWPDLSITNVSSEVYEIFDMTGFTEMMKVEKAYRVISVDGCEVIGEGANGKVYRIDRDTIVKVYMNPDSLPDIQRERELAREAFVLGIPTAIPYDVVRVGEGYGSVFELLNATSFAKMIVADPSETDHVIRMSVDLLKKIHSTKVKPGSMPDMKAVAVKWCSFMKDYLPEETYTKLMDMVTAVPECDHMLHGDYHIKNVMLQDGEVLLIDMDTLCVGHPVFEFASIYNAYQGFSETDHSNIERFLGITFETGKKLWDKTLEYYFDDKTPEEIEKIAGKARIIGYTRMMRRAIRRDGLNDDYVTKHIAFCREQIIQLVSENDSLTWD
jgi:uncharacterized protein (TIGR02172 family)